MHKFLNYVCIFLFMLSTLTACTDLAKNDMSSDWIDEQEDEDFFEAKQKIFIQENNGVVSGNAFMLDTNCMISIYDKNPDLDKKQILEKSFSKIEQLENQLSWKIADSEISQINNRTKNSLSDEAFTLLDEALQFSKKTDGAFDITVGTLTDLWGFSSGSQIVPKDEEIEKALQAVGYQNIQITDRQISFENSQTKLDLGGIAKGYIADQVKTFLISEKVENAIINLGGNVLCLGGKNPDQGFVIGIQNPFHEGYLLTVETNEKYSSIVTSGVYERCFEKDGQFYHHILNTKTGYPVQNNLLSVTILSEHGLEGDTLSTTCFVLGLTDGLQLINEMKNVHAIFIDKNYQIYYSENLKQDLQIEEMEP